MVEDLIIAIDPSTTATGIALMKRPNLIKTCLIKTKEKEEDRYFDIMNQVIDFVKENDYPTTLVVETSYFSVNVGTAMKLSFLRGVIQGAYARVMEEAGKEYNIVSLNPATVKKLNGVTTKGLKRIDSKKAIRHNVRCVFGEIIDTLKEDEVDAVSIGLAYLRNVI